MKRDRIGKYQVLRKLGEGGMGSVFLARHAQIGRRVAIKVLLPQHTQNRDVRRRFFNEARATAAIRHPGLVEIFDFGELDDGSAYLVMELLEGETLAQRIARGPVGAALTTEIGRQLAAAVEAAHAHGIVHRDLKPENMILLADPDLPFKVRVKVLDFGIAKLTLEPATSRTASQLLLGTPAYMSPEQCRGAASVDHRTDVYAIGCVLFEMVCGRLPFAFDNIADLIAAHINDEPPDPLALVPAIPLSLRAVMLRCLAKTPGQRYQSAAAVAHALSAGVTVARPLHGTKRAAVVDEETRVDPQIATRMAAEWDAEPTTQHGWRKATPSSRTAAHETRSQPSTLRSTRGLWETRLSILAIIAGAFAAGSTILAAAAPSVPQAVQRPTLSAARSSTVGVLTRPGASTRPASNQVELRIETIPPGAEVVSGAVVLGTTPLNVSSRAAAGTAEVDVRLQGYSSRKVRFDTDRDEHFTIRLRPRFEERHLLADREPDAGRP